MGGSVLRRILRCLPLVAFALLGGCVGILDPAGPVGRDDATILIDATLIMLAIIVPTILLAFWMAWRYRASNTKAQYLPYCGRYFSGSALNRSRLSAEANR